ncbi:MAG: hypothetical protein Q8N30_18345 [Methylococcales bacterium]|nr:hypothetical protein [Methylococcales bacterium]
MNEINDEPLTATISAAFLRSMGNVLNSWSMLLALAAILIIGLKTNSGYSVALLSASVSAALIQAYFAARCAFNAAVFAALGGEITQYAGFDRLLTRWKLRGENVASRSLDKRVRGAIGLLRWQAYSFCGQIILLGVGLYYS